MHGGYRDSYALDETATAYDLEQTPADLVALSFSDSDLGAFAAGWHRAGGTLPTLRLANLVALRHPMSVDTYIDATLTHAKGILIRLIGGETYWSYGLQQVRDLAQRRGIALAVLPGDGREDTQLDAFSTLPVSTLRRLSALCDAGGALAAQAALAQLALAAGLYAGPVQGEKIVPDYGWYDPARGVVAEPASTDRPLIVVTFYRSYLTAADTGPVDALIEAFRSRGFDAIGLFVPSLKAPGATEWTREALRKLAPAAIVNATAFSARGDDGTSPLDAPGCPVFQVALSTARKREWAASERGLSAADLAMHVVLPEIDGRIFAGVTSFKSPGKRDPDLQYSRFAHRADQRADRGDRRSRHGLASPGDDSGAVTQAGAGALDLSRPCGPDGACGGARRAGIDGSDPVRSGQGRLCDHRRRATRSGTVVANAGLAGARISRGARRASRAIADRPRRRMGRA